MRIGMQELASTPSKSDADERDDHQDLVYFVLADVHVLPTLSQASYVPYNADKPLVYEHE